MFDDIAVLIPAYNLPSSLLKELLPNLCKIKGDRFEYETNVLKFLAKEIIIINKINIETIYNDNGSHYKIFKDSISIFMNIINKNDF